MVNHENGLLREEQGPGTYMFPKLEIYGVDDDGVEHHAPLRDIVREARKVERPAIICKKIDVLARSNDVSITMTFEPTIDIDARATAKFVLAMTKQLREMGFDTKDAPRPASNYSGQRASKPSPPQHRRVDGSLMFCPCGKRVLIFGTGNAMCEDYKDKSFKGHHTFIAKAVLDGVQG